MSRISILIRDFGADQHGGTAIEYGFVASLISLTIIGSATQMGQTVLGFLQAVADAFNP